jgi:adenine-specific DNA-methyltransferase
MDKLKMHTPNKADENFKKLAELFPNAVTETIDENGEVVRAIDKDVLMQEINTHVVDGKEERYQFTWPDKKKSVLLANAPINKTLRPCREESVGKDGTPGGFDSENLYIEGDNLEVLKLLQETYLGKIKMIYIDPPYNTGNDFVYEDNFAQSTEEYLANSGQFDEEGNRLVKNLDSNGRFHTDWLNMIYPRLKLAKDLLSDDGVVFMSIDDNEIENLRKICNEIFGEENFIAQIIWKKRSTPPNDKVIGAAHEYILSFGKNISNTKLHLRARTQEQLMRYQNPDNHPKGPWAPGDLSANVKGGRYVASLYYPIINPNTGEEHYPPQNGNWRFNKQTVEKLLKNNEISFGNDGKGRPKLKRFLCDVKEGITYTSLWDFVPLNTQGSKEMTELLGNIAIFDNPKPADLIKELVKLGGDNNAIILDFFSGSATTAHAVMQQNAEDGGKRKFIMVQLPEETDEKSEAYKAGYKNICEIGKERIRRAGAKIKEEAGLTAQNLDVGFRVLKCDTSNMKDIYYSPSDFDMNLLDMMADNIKEDRTPEDLLFQVMLDLGVELSSKIEETTIAGKKVFDVADGFLIACFDKDVNEETIKAIAQKQPYYFVMRDSSLANDSVATNFEQIFATYSPDTVRKVL